MKFSRVWRLFIRPEDRDTALLWDMREAAQEIEEFIKGVSYDQFVSQKALRYAIERQIIVIGEAARRVWGHIFNCQFNISHKKAKDHIIKPGQALPSSPHPFLPF